jgi:hypothetical protein
MKSNIEASIRRIERILMLRYWLFGFIIIAITVCALAIYNDSSAILGIDKRLTEQDSRSAKNAAMIEAAIRQQTIFQATLAQIMDKMSKDNPKIRVPRAPVKPPVPPFTTPTPIPTLTPIQSQTPDPASPLTDAELTRSPSAKSTPAKSSSVARKRKPKPKPTPTPFRWPWTK